MESQSVSSSPLSQTPTGIATAHNRMTANLSQAHSPAHDLAPTALWKTLKEGLLCATDLPSAKHTRPLWHCLYPASVVLLNGDTGIGKSSLLLIVAVHGASGKPLFGMEFSETLRVLYIDPENAGNWKGGDGGETATRLDQIGLGKPETLWLHSGDGVNRADAHCLSWLKAVIQKYRLDLVVVDPIAAMIATSDENDNMEARRQRDALRATGRETGACIVLCHHTGKYSEDGGGKRWAGRGASARADAADMVVYVSGGEARTENAEPEERIRITVPKIRLGKRADPLVVRKVGNCRFERVAESAEEKPAAQEARFTATLQEILTQSADLSLAELRTAVKKRMNVADRKLTEMLERAVGSGLLVTKYIHKTGKFYSLANKPTEVTA